MRTERGQHTQVIKAQVGQTQAAFRQRSLLDAQAMVRRATIGQIQPTQRSSEQIELDATLERGRGMLGRAATTAAPVVSQAIGEHNCGAVVDAHTREALQDRNGNAISGNQMLHTARDNLLQQGGGGKGETLINRLWRDINTDAGSTVGQLLDAGIRMSQETQNECLRQRAGGKLGPIRTLGIVQFGVGVLCRRSQELLHGLRDLWYRAHWKLLASSGCVATP